MKLRKIIREEIDDFDWAKDVLPGLEFPWVIINDNDKGEDIQNHLFNIGWDWFDRDKTLRHLNKEAYAAIWPQDLEAKTFGFFDGNEEEILKWVDNKYKEEQEQEEDDEYNLGFTSDELNVYRWSEMVDEGNINEQDESDDGFDWVKDVEPFPRPGTKRKWRIDNDMTEEDPHMTRVQKYLFDIGWVWQGDEEVSEVFESMDTHMVYLISTSWGKYSRHLDGSEDDGTYDTFAFAGSLGNEDKDVEWADDVFKASDLVGLLKESDMDWIKDVDETDSWFTTEYVLYEDEEGTGLLDADQYEDGSARDSQIIVGEPREIDRYTLIHPKLNWDDLDDIHHKIYYGWLNHGELPKGGTYVWVEEFEKFVKREETINESNDFDWVGDVPIEITSIGDLNLGDKYRVVGTDTDEVEIDHIGTLMDITDREFYIKFDSIIYDKYDEQITSDELSDGYDHPECEGRCYPFWHWELEGTKRGEDIFDEKDMEKLIKVYEL